MPLLNIISFALVQWVLLSPTNRFGFTPSPSLGLLAITLTHYLYIFLIKQELHMSLEVAFMIGGIGLLNLGAMTSVVPSFGVSYDDCFYTVVVGFFASLALNVQIHISQFMMGLGTPEIADTAPGYHPENISVSFIMTRGLLGIIISLFMYACDGVAPTFSPYTVFVIFAGKAYRF